MSITEAALATVKRPGPSPIMLYDAACKAIAAARSVDEVKEVRDQAEAMRAYARQAKNKQLEIDASEIRFRAERRIGELMDGQRETVGLNSGASAGGKKESPRGSYSDPRDLRPTLAEAGIDKHLADRARKYAAIPEDQFEGILADRRDRIETENKRVTVNLIEAGVRGTLGTGENEWYTPSEYIEAARDVLGGIDLDPASSDAAQKIVKAKCFFTAELNGLNQGWNGRVWLNPPYAQPLIGEFIHKLANEREAGRIEAAIILTHNYTDTAWFHQAASIADAICFTRGRVKFYDPNGVIAAPTQGQAFFYCGIEVEKFCERFEDFGFLVVTAQSNKNPGRS